MGCVELEFYLLLVMCIGSLQCSVVQAGTSRVRIAACLKVTGLAINLVPRK